MSASYVILNDLLKTQKWVSTDKNPNFYNEQYYSKT